MIGLHDGQVLDGPAWIEAVIEDRHPRWPIKRVEFYIDGKPYSYMTKAPYLLERSRMVAGSRSCPRKHTLRVAAFDMRGPRFTETCTIKEIPFSIAKAGER